VNGRSSISLVRKATMLEAGGSIILFSCENWGSFWKEYLQSERVLKWENCSIYEKYSLQKKWRNTCILWMIQSVLNAEVSYTLFPYEDWVSFWKEYCLLVRIASCHQSVAWAAAGFFPCRKKPSVPCLLPPSFACP
jgi:hypothetical protein